MSTKALIENTLRTHGLARDIVIQAIQDDQMDVCVEVRDLEKHISKVRAYAAIAAKRAMEQLAEELASAILALDLELVRAEFSVGYVEGYDVNVSVK